MGKSRNFSKKGSKTGVYKLRSLERDREAMKLRLSGLDYPEIAKRMGWSNRSVAWHAVNRQLELIKSEIGEDAKKVIELELQRLDEMLVVCWDEVKDGNLRAMDRVLRIMERRERYLGLDAARRVELSGPDGGPMEVDVTKLSIEELEKLARG